MDINKKIVKKYLISLGYDVIGITNIEKYDSYNSFNKISSSSIGVRYNIRFDKNKIEYIILKISEIEQYKLIELRKLKIESL